MNDRTDFESTLAGWLEAEAPGTPPVALLERVVNVTSRTRPLPAWRAWISVPVMRTQAAVLVGSPTLRLARILVALLLLGALMVAAVVVGSQAVRELYRVALPVENNKGPLPTATPTPPSLAAGCPYGAAPAEPPLVRLIMPGTELRLYEDGLLLGIPFDTSIDSTQRLTARRLAPAGVAAYLAAIEDAGLAGTCREFKASRLSASILATLPAGTVQVLWSVGETSSPRVLTRDEEQAAADLVGRLSSPETWLSADAWVASEAEIYDTDRWEVAVQFLEPTGPAEHDPKDLALTDGKTMADFGVRMHTRTLACATVTTAEALDLQAQLRASDANLRSEVWEFGDYGIVQVVALMPEFPTCEERAADVVGPPQEPTPGPSQVPSQVPSPGPDFAGLDACDLLPVSSVEEVAAGRIETTVGFGSILGGPISECHFTAQGAPWDSETLSVILRVETTTAGEAELLSRDLFGETQREAMPSGGYLWVNRCLQDLTLRCMPALVVSLEPYFVVLAVHIHTDYTEAQVRALGEIVLANLHRRTDAR